ncbi:MAG: metFprotein, partial [Pseudomonadota bacterium]
MSESNEIAAIQTLMRDASVEITPGAAAKIADFREILSTNSEVFVTFLPGSNPLDTLGVVKRLHAQSMRPVPHIAARSLASIAMLDQLLGQLHDEAGINHALLIGGGVAKPLGPFASSMEVLETGLLQRHGFTRIGIAGHPEGSPDIPEQAVREALIAKNRFARDHGVQMYITTQFCFELAPIKAWEQRLAEWGNQLPVHIGLAGLATLKTLLKHAYACGIGNSMRVLTRQSKNLTHLLSVKAPDRLVRELAG